MINTLQTRFTTKFFKNPLQQEQYADKGYVVAPLFSEEVISEMREKLLAVRSTINEDVTQGVFATGCSPNYQLRNTIGDIIDHYVSLHIHELLDANAAAFLGGTMLLKAPGPTGLLGPHIDNPIVDETVTSSLFAWIPTEDVNEENGCVYVLPGSHRLGHSARGMYTNYPYRDFDDLVYENVVSVPMKAGEVLLMDHALIHLSHPNKTDKERFAVAFGIKPKAAQQYHFFKDQNQDKIAVYDIDKQFYFHEDIFSAPPENYQILRYIEPFTNPYSRSEFEAFIKSA